MAPCKQCDAKCCRYFALQIDAPQTNDDAENVRWYLAHKNIKVMVHKRKWYLEVANDCRYLSTTRTCRIYKKRPRICRQHRIEDCEFWDSDFGFTNYFHTMEAFDRYWNERRRRKRRRVR